MKDITVIIHGWSDSSASFERLKKQLIKEGLGSVKTVLYADYESREDHLTFDDVVDGLNDQFIDCGLIDADGRKRVGINIICHSTGGLVIRHWIWRYYGQDGRRPAACPVRRIVMLAPANFGSPLAHRGKSFFPSIVKGRKGFGNFLETGRQILDGLELGSPYQWQLAHGDLIRPRPYFNAYGIQTTIMVGIEGYRGMAACVNKPGTDGTVVIAGTSLDAAKLTLDFSKPHNRFKTYTPYHWTVKKPAGDFAFAVLEGLDHGTIVSEAAAPGTEVSTLLLQALRVKNPASFLVHQDKLEEITARTYRRTGKPKYQQFLVHAVDDSGRSIRDYTLEFFVKKDGARSAGEAAGDERLNRAELSFSEKVSEAVTEQFHTHKVDESHRSFLVDLDRVRGLIEEAKVKLGGEVSLFMRVYVPKVDDGIQYRTESLQNIVIYHSGGPRRGEPAFFFENTTTLLELKVNRYNTYVTLSEQPRKH